MALIILEGLDRTGKSTVAQYYSTLGYELIHLSAPPKGMSSDQYMQEMADLISSASTKDVVLDRSHYGELVWSQVYGRASLLSDDDIVSLREIEEVVGTHRIMMHDPNIEAHWKRCVENNEPLDKSQFVKARNLYSHMTQKYGFEPMTLPQFIKINPEADSNSKQNMSATDSTDTSSEQPKSAKTPEQIKLEKANAINDILSKRILKQKGDMYEDLEKDIRDFLNSKLGRLFGEKTDLSLTSEEIKFYKAMYKKAVQKGER